MFLSKRNGIWYVWYSDGQGKRRKVSTGYKQKSDALQFLTTFLAPQSSDARPIPRFAEFKSMVLDYVKANYAHGTYLIYRDSLKYLEAIIGDISIDQITPFHFDLFKSKRSPEVSPESVNIGLRNIKAAMGFAVRWKLLVANPFSRLSMARIPEKAPMFFSRDEFQKLYLAIDKEWFREIVTFSLLTGMREGEILNLRRTDVDLESGFVRVECSPSFKTKMGKRRTLPLNKDALELLSGKSGLAGESLLFTLNGNKINKYWIDHLFRRYRKKAGLNRPLTFHSLRHTFASWLALDVVSIYQISKLLGHSDVAVTQHYYAHLQSSELKEAVDRISLGLTPQRNYGRIAMGKD